MFFCVAKKKHQAKETTMENILAGNDKVAMLVTLIRQLSGDAALSGFMGMPELQTSLAAANDVAHEVLATREDEVARPE